ncbi:hypothetical protein Bca4012_091052 [Brassica carinata]
MHQLPSSLISKQTETDRRVYQVTPRNRVDLLVYLLERNLKDSPAFTPLASQNALHSFPSHILPDLLSASRLVDLLKPYLSTRVIVLAFSLPFNHTSLPDFLRVYGVGVSVKNLSWLVEDEDEEEARRQFRFKPSPSSWCFFERLDFLIGPVAAKKSTGVVRPALKNPTGSKSSGSSLEEEDDDDEVGDWGFVVRKHRRVEDVDPSGGEGSSCRELARAILKLGEVYERIEGVKQRMMVELEKQRMEAAKELELQRMNMEEVVGIRFVEKLYCGRAKEHSLVLRS